MIYLLAFCLLLVSALVGVVSYSGISINTILRMNALHILVSKSMKAFIEKRPDLELMFEKSRAEVVNLMIGDKLYHDLMMLYSKEFQRLVNKFGRDDIKGRIFRDYFNSTLVFESDYLNSSDYCDLELFDIKRYSNVLFYYISIVYSARLRDKIRYGIVLFKSVSDTNLFKKYEFTSNVPDIFSSNMLTEVNHNAEEFYVIMSHLFKS